MTTRTIPLVFFRTASIEKRFGYADVATGITAIKNRNGVISKVERTHFKAIYGGFVQMPSFVFSTERELYLYIVDYEFSSEKIVFIF